MSRRRSVLVLTALSAVFVLVTGLVVGLAGPAAAATPTGLHVSGNHLLDGSGHPVVLRGVNRSGTEYACIQNNGIFDGPSDAASIAAMAAWHVNAVRVPLNEDCWLGINGANAAYSGATYANAITGYVSRLHAAGLVAILDLHWTAAGSAPSSSAQDMPDADHAPAFWTSVATTFKSDGSTVFDLFNEPHDVSWTCWRDGGDCGIGYTVAGMQSLVDAVRATGATNPVLVGGLAYANDLSQWLSYRPADFTGNLMASWHSYNFNSCTTTSCWDGQVAPVAASVPLVTGEVGENDCAHGYLDALLPWLDSHGAGYLGWGWDTYDCSSFPALISSYDGTPTNFGIGLRDHLAGLSSTTGSTTTSTSTTRSTTTRSTTTSTTPTTPTTPTTATSTTPTTATSTTRSTTTASSTATTRSTSTPSPTPSTTGSTTTTSSTGTSSTGGGLSVTRAAQTGSAPWWWEEDLNLTPSGTVTALTVTITVARTAGISPAGFWSNAPGGALTLTQTSGSGALTYQATLNAGHTLTSALTVAAQFSGTGTAHSTSGDRYTVTAVVGGQAVSAGGTF